MSFWGKIKGFMVSPTETFNTVREEGWGESIVYFAKLLIIFAILVAVIIVAIFAAIWGLPEAFIPAEVPGLGGFLGLAVYALIFIIIGGIIGGIIAILVGSLWMHIWVYAVGGRKGVGQTIKFMAYGSTPSLVLGWCIPIVSLIGWIPIVNLIGWIWSLVVSIIGIRQLHEISTGRAVLAYIIGAIIPIIIVIVILVEFKIILLGATPQASI